MIYKYLFVFTISPVQSFIAQARKTQDLYAGSQILSQLTKKAIETIGVDNVIFPNTKNLDKVESLPNRLVAQFEGTAEQANSKGQQVEKAVLGEFRKLANTALSNAKVSFQIDDWDKDITTEIPLQKAFKQQINKHLEMYWLFQLVDTEGEDVYKKAFAQLERKLGAIKNIRQFEQFDYDGVGEKGRKCSIDGERNALFFGVGTNEKYCGKGSKWNPDAVIVENADYVKLSANEGLSGVSLTKRFYDKTGFPSTAKIALMQDLDNLSKIDDLDVKTLFICYKGYFNNVDFDEQLFFEENLNEDYFNKNGLAKYCIKLPQIRETQKKFQTHLKSRYYAILTFDGDNMGQWLSGDMTPNIDLSEFHKKLSECLGEFAKEIRLDTPKGKIVYAGGDDFLGLVNLDNLFEVLKNLKSDFNQKVNQELKKWFPISENLNFSAGVAIAHYKTPLNIVLNNARRVLDKSKELDNKNALGISVLKHSGRDHDVCLAWEKDAVDMNELQNIVDKLKNDFSGKWIYNLSQEFALFTEDKENDPDASKIKPEHRDMIRAEIERLLGRACKRLDLKKEDKKSLITAIKTDVNKLLSKVDYNFTEFTELLSIADFMATKKD